MSSPAIASLAAAAVALCSANAAAHIRLDFPAPRSAHQKYGPCGALGSVRGDVVTTFAPGETITVRWQETIGHPGHYRVSFDADGQDDFVDPASYTDTYSAPSVLLDEIADAPGTGPYTADVTLPNIECDNCTLQLIQMMTDKPPYGDGNDIYYQCADLVLVAAGGGGAGGSAGAGGTGGSGGSSAASGSAGSAGSAANATSGDDASGGCACETRGAGGASPVAIALLGFSLLAFRRRRLLRNARSA
jgi:MYXO-CTERM domain-containing protein